MLDLAALGRFVKNAQHLLCPRNRAEAFSCGREVGHGFSRNRPKLGPVFLDDLGECILVVRGEGALPLHHAVNSVEGFGETRWFIREV